MCWLRKNERFEATNKDLCGIDKKFDIEFDELEVSMEKVVEARSVADLARQLSVARGIPVVR